MSRYNLAILLGILFMFGSIHCQDGAETNDIPLISQENIQKHRVNIARTMKWHWFLRLGTQVGGFAVGSYWIYQTFFAPGLVVVKTGSKRPSSVVSASKKEVNRLYAMLHKFSPRFLSWQWWKNAAFKFADHIVFASVLSIGERLLGRYFHDDDVIWFVKEKTRIVHLQQEIRGYAEKIKAITAMSDQECEYYSVMLVGLCRQLVQQVEKLAGFMEYQFEQFKNRGAILTDDEILQVPHLVATTDQFVRQMTALLPLRKDRSSKVDLKKPFELLLFFAVDLDLQIKRFTGLESGIEWRLING